MALELIADGYCPRAGVRLLKHVFGVGKTSQARLEADNEAIRRPVNHDEENAEERLRSRTMCYFASTLDVIDAITVEAILN